MTIILHTIWKDIILCRWLYVALALYYAAYAYFLQETAADETHMTVSQLSKLFFVTGGTLIPILALGLTATIDPRANSDAFLQTRPISTGKLFLAKLFTSIVVVVGFPFYSELLLAAFFGTYPKFMLVESFVHAGPFMLVFTIASASHSSVSVFKNTFICLVTLGLLYVLLLATNTIDNSPRGLADITGLWNGPSLKAIESVFAGIAAVSIAVFQFWTKRNRVALILVVCSASILLLNSQFAKNRPSFINPSIDSSLQTEAEVSSVVSREIGRKLSSELSRGYEKKDILYAYVDAKGTFDTDEIVPVLINGSALIENQTINPSYNRSVYRDLSLSNYNFEKIAKSLGLSQYLNSYRQELESNRFPILDITQAEQRKYENSRAVFTGKVGLLRMRYLPILRIPLIESSTVISGPYRGNVRNLIIDDNRIRFTGTIDYSYSKFDPNSPYWQRLQMLAPRRQELFLLVNKVTHEAIIPSAFSDQKSSLDYQRKRTELRQHRALSYNVEYHRPPSVDQDWLKRAEVVIIDKHIVDTEEIDFEIRNIKL